jgi:hypothetical protein
VAWKNISISPIAGNVGIGTTEPSGKLHVYGGSFITDLDATYHQGILNEYVSAYVTRTKFGRWNNSSNLEIYYDIAGSEEARITRNYNTAVLKFDRAGTTDMIISGSGNVGIGTTTANTLLSIDGVADDGISIQGIGTTATRAFFGLDASGDGYMSLTNGGTFVKNVQLTSDLGVNNYILGNVGIGTTAPSARLTVKSLSSGALGINILGRDGDSYGLLTFKDSGDTSTFAEVGGNTSAGFLVNNYVNTYTAFSTNSVERMRITAGGNVLINTTTDGGYKLRVNGEILADDDIRIFNTYALVLNGTDNNWRIGRNTITDSGWLTGNTMQMVVFGGSTGQGFQVVNSNGTALFEIDGVAGASRFTDALGVGVNPSGTAGRIDASNDIVAYSSSDLRLKENIKPIENALDKVKALTGVEFDWKAEHKEAHGYEGHDTGIIAQEVQEVMPTAVRVNDTGYLAVRYEKLIGLLVEANKELAARVEELEKKLK